MISKPPTGDGCGMEQLVFVCRPCLYMVIKPGDLLDETVGVGGPVPCVLIDQEDLPVCLEPHVGTTDLDMGLDGGRLESRALSRAGRQVVGRGI